MRVYAVEEETQHPLGSSDTPSRLLPALCLLMSSKGKPISAASQAQNREQPWCQIWSCRQLKLYNGQKGDAKDSPSQQSTAMSLE